MFSKAVGAVLVPLLGCVLCPPAGAQSSPDQSIEFLETLEIADTLAEEEEREINIPKPDTTTLVPFKGLFKGLIVSTITKTPLVSQAKRGVARDSIADRKGLWQTVRLMAARAERRVSLAALDTTAAVPFNGLKATTISKKSVVPQEKPATDTPSGFHRRPQSTSENRQTDQIRTAPISTSGPQAGMGRHGRVTHKHRCRRGRGKRRHSKKHGLRRP